MKQDPYYNKRLQKSKSIRKQRRVRPLSEEIQSTCRLLLTTIGSIMLVLFISFLYVNSRQSAKGYYLKQLQIDHETLIIENRELQGDLNQAQSINTLNEGEKVEDMENPTNEDYTYVGPASDLAIR
jgi:hypothetical protein